MSDRPILMSGPMVRALLDSRKTQTRRIIKPVVGAPKAGDVAAGEHVATFFRPRFAVGDRLWVREALRPHPIGAELLAALGFAEAPPEKVDMSRNDLCIAYDADGEAVVDERGFDLAWLWKARRLNSMYMPRSLSRLTLAVTEVRVERLQEISEDDAAAEAAPWYVGGHGVISDDEYRMEPGYQASKRPGFEWLWNEINGWNPPAWQQNPFVAAVSFTVHRCNIDKMAQKEPA